jgi:hypothetical protein
MIEIPFSPAKRALPIAFFAICLCVVIYAIFRPEPPPELFSQSDKWGHIAAFLALCVSGRLAFPSIPAAPFWLAFVALAPLLEWLQHLVRPLRYFSYGDVLANLGGVLLAMVLLNLLSLWQGRARVMPSRH